MEIVGEPQKQGFKGGYLSEIYFAKRPSGASVVIKKNRTPPSDDQRSFFRYLMSDSPPGLLVPLEVGEWKGPFSEFYPLVSLPDGDDVRKQIVFGDLSWPFSHLVKFARGYASALGSIHDQGFLQFDVRNENVFLDPDTAEVLVFDYNLLSSPFTSNGRVSWNDTPPEYIVKGARIDQRFDVWRFGKALEGFLPSGSPFLSHPLYSNLAEIISRALRDCPNERYPNAGLIARDLGILEQRLLGVSDQKL